MEEKHAIEVEKQTMAALLDQRTAEIRELIAKVDGLRMTIVERAADIDGLRRARDIACFNVADLTSQRTALTDTLHQAMQLIEYLIGDMRNAGVVPSVACGVAKKAFQDRMSKLFKLRGADQQREAQGASQSLPRSPGEPSPHEGN